MGLKRPRQEKKKKLVANKQKKQKLQPEALQTRLEGGLKNYFPTVIVSLITRYLIRDVIWVLTEIGSIYTFDPFNLSPRPWNWKEEDVKQRMEPPASSMGEIIRHPCEIHKIFNSKEFTKEMYWFPVQTRDNQPQIMCVQHVNQTTSGCDLYVRVSILDYQQLLQTNRIARSIATWYPPIQSGENCKLRALASHPIEKHIVLLVYQKANSIVVDAYDINTQVQTLCSSNVSTHYDGSFEFDSIFSDSRRLWIISYVVGRIRLHTLSFPTLQWELHDLVLPNRHVSSMANAPPVIWNNHLLLIAGRDSIHYGETSRVVSISLGDFSMEEYNIDRPRMGHSAVVLDHSLVVLGGSHRDSGLKDTLIYQEEWRVKHQWNQSIACQSPQEWNQIASSFVLPLLDICV
jgi:hypothetical protein